MSSLKQPVIKNREMLQQAMAQLNEQINQQEQSIGNRLHKVPSELLKSASGAILPAVLNVSTLSGMWNLLKLVPIAQSIFSLLRKKSSK